MEQKLVDYIQNNVAMLDGVTKKRMTIYKGWSNQNRTVGRINFFGDWPIVSYFLIEENGVVSGWRTRKVTQEPDFKINLKEIS